MRLSDVRTRFGKLSRTRKITGLGGLGTIFIVPMIVGVLAPRLDRAIEGTPPAVQASANLEVLDVSVIGGVAIPPTIDLTVRNTGDTVSVVTGARLTIRDFGLIRICEGAGGSLGSSAEYDVQLPVEPTIGDVVEARLSQQILADEADRFSLRLTLPETAVLEGVGLYYLDVGLLHDTGDEALAASGAIVPLPFLPPATFFSPEGAAREDEMGACFRRNEDTLSRFVALQGARPSGLQEDLALGYPSYAPAPEGTHAATASELPIGDGGAPVIQPLAGTGQAFTGLAESEGLVCTEFESGVACDSETGETWLVMITTDGDYVEGISASGRGPSTGPPDFFLEAARMATASDEARDWTDMPSPGADAVSEIFNGHEIYLSEANGVWFMMVGTLPG